MHRRHTRALLPLLLVALAAASVVAAEPSPTESDGTPEGNVLAGYTGISRVVGEKHFLPALRAGRSSPIRSTDPEEPTKTKRTQ